MMPTFAFLYYMMLSPLKFWKELKDPEPIVVTEDQKAHIKHLKEVL